MQVTPFQLHICIIYETSISLSHLFVALHQDLPRSVTRALLVHLFFYKLLHPFYYNRVLLKNTFRHVLRVLSEQLNNIFLTFTLPK